MIIWCSSEDFVDVIVEGGAVPLLVEHLQAPPYGDGALKPLEHEVEKGSALALGYLAIKVLIHTLHSCCYLLKSSYLRWMVYVIFVCLFWN